MKKLIIASVIFAAMLSLAIWESAYSTKLYNDLYDGLEAVELSMELHEDNIANPDTAGKMEAVLTRWQNAKEVLFCLGNHNTLRAVDEKLVSLNRMVEINYADDAAVIIEVTKSLLRALDNDTQPVLTNIL